MVLMPEGTVSKLNTVLSGLIARPQPPSRPDVVRLDQLQKELDHAKQVQDPVARMAAVTQGYDNWRREYDKFLGSVNPTPTASFIPPPPLSPPPLSPPGSRPSSPYEEKTGDDAYDDDDDDTYTDAEEKEDEEDEEIKVEPPSFTCPECQQVFKSKSGLTRHAKQHKIWLGKGETPPGLQRLKNEAGDEAKTGQGIVFYPASSRQ